MKLNKFYVNNSTRKFLKEFAYILPFTFVYFLSVNLIIKNLAAWPDSYFDHIIATEIIKGSRSGLDIFFSLPPYNGSQKALFLIPFIKLFKNFDFIVSFPSVLSHLFASIFIYFLPRMINVINTPLIIRIIAFQLILFAPSLLLYSVYDYGPVSFKIPSLIIYFSFFIYLLDLEQDQNLNINKNVSSLIFILFSFIGAQSITHHLINIAFILPPQVILIFKKPFRIFSTIPIYLISFLPSLLFVYRRGINSEIISISQNANIQFKIDAINQIYHGLIPINYSLTFEKFIPFVIGILSINFTYLFYKFLKNIQLRNSKIIHHNLNWYLFFCILSSLVLFFNFPYNLFYRHAVPFLVLLILLIYSFNYKKLIHLIEKKYLIKVISISIYLALLINSLNINNIFVKEINSEKSIFDSPYWRSDITELSKYINKYNNGEKKIYPHFWLGPQVLRVFYNLDKNFNLQQIKDTEWIDVMPGKNIIKDDFIKKGIHIFREIDELNASKMNSYNCQRKISPEPFTIFDCN